MVGLAKHITPFAVSGITPEQLVAAIDGAQFTECLPSSMQSSGFVPVDKVSITRKVGDVIAFAFREDKKILPASVITAAAQERAREIEEVQGYKPGRKQFRQIKDAVTDELTTQAFIKRTITYGWADFGSNILSIATGSAPRAENICICILRGCPDMTFVRPRTNISPCSGMTSWLAGDSPDQFTVDDKAKLFTPGGTGELRVSGKDAHAVAPYLNEGMAVSELAMTFASKTSFVLTDGLILKRIAHLDINNEPAETQEDLDEEGKFDAEILLNAQTARDVVCSLAGALGGMEA